MLFKENDLQLPWRQKARRVMLSPKGEAPTVLWQTERSKGQAQSSFFLREDRQGQG